MRTRILNHFHTFHPEAQAEHDRLAIEEKRLTRELARRGSEDDGEPVRRRMSEPPEDLDGALADVRAKIKEQKAIIASGVVRIHVKGLTRGEFRRMLTAHPPREDDDLDARLGYNGDTFPDAFIQASIVRTDSLDGDPVDTDWDRWADDMTNGQYEEVLTACMRLTNDGQPSLPR
jgi:hypothetical protein